MKALLLAGLACLSLRAQPGAAAFTLPNGLRVWHLEDHERPLVRARLHLRLDPSDVPPGRQGLPRLFLGMLEASDAADLNARAFDRLLADSGIQFAPFLEAGGLGWQVAARSRDQDRAMGLLADRLLRTVFEGSVLEAQRLACWRAEERGTAAQTRLQEALLQPPSFRPSLASLSAISLEDLLAFRARVIRPDRAVLVLQGDLGLEQAKRLVLLNLGTWTAQEAPPAPPASSAGPDEPPSPLRIIEPGTSIQVQAAAPRPAGVPPEVEALLGLLLPGDPALAPMQIRVGGECLLASIEGPEASEAALRQRLEALRRRAFTQADLDRARSIWLARQSLETLDPETRLASALDQALGRGASAARMAQLALNDLQEGLRRWLDPQGFRIGVSGGPEALKKAGGGPNGEPGGS